MTIIAIAGFVAGGLAWIIYALATLFYNKVIKEEKKIQDVGDIPINGKSIIYDFIDLKPPPYPFDKYDQLRNKFYNSLGVPSSILSQGLKYAHDLAISSGNQTSKTKLSKRP
jgi:hypothetical protein